MESGHESGDAASSQLIFDAHAMAMGTIKETEFQQMIASGIDTDSSDEDVLPTIIRELLSATMGHQLADILAGYPMRTTGEYTREAMSVFTADDLRELLDETDDSEEESLAQLQLKIVDFAEAMECLKSNDEAKQIITLHKKAREMAAEKGGITVENIFSNDSLYEEFLRRLYPPEEFAKGVLHVVNQINIDEAFDAISKLHSDDQDDYDENDEYLAAKKDEFITALAESTARIIKTQLKRFWGEAGFESLSEGTKDQIKFLAEGSDLGPALN